MKFKQSQAKSASEGNGADISTTESSRRQVQPAKIADLSVQPVHIDLKFNQLT